MDRFTTTEVTEQVGTTQRVSLGLISLSLGLMSLALGLAFINSPAALLVLPKILALTPSSATAVTLTWTAPGDDGTIGQATSYNIRYSKSPLTALNFSAATAVSTPPTPATSGSTESFTVTNLQPSTTYFFGLKARDEANNVSGISNIATKTTSALACTPIYSCTAWSACVNGHKTRSCSVTNGCTSGLDAPITSQTCTSPAPEPVPVPAPVPAPAPIPPATGGEPVALKNPLLVAGIGKRTIPVVRIVNPKKQTILREFLVLPRADRNGVHVSAGDVTGDHKAEIVIGTGVGSDPLVKIFTDQGTLLAQFNPYPASRKIGVAVATGDVDGDGTAEILTIPAASAAQVRIFKYSASSRKVTVVTQSFVYPTAAHNGFTIETGDLNLDGKAEFIVAARTNGSTVSTFRVTSDKKIVRLLKFSPYNYTFATGITTAVGDVNGDGRGDILTTAGPNYYSHVKAFTTAGKLIAGFLPASTAYRGGVDLTTFDVNGDGRDEVITATYGTGDPGIRTFRYSGATKTFSRIQSYFVFPRTMQDGLRIDAVPHT